MPVDEGK